jgi:hypothetical protein
MNGNVYKADISNAKEEGQRYSAERVWYIEKAIAIDTIYDFPLQLGRGGGPDVGYYALTFDKKLYNCN